MNDYLGSPTIGHSTLLNTSLLNTLIERNMSISVTCNCGRTLNLADDLEGKTIRCPECSEPVRVSGDGGAKARGKKRQNAAVDRNTRRRRKTEAYDEGDYEDDFDDGPVSQPKRKPRRKSKGKKSKRKSKQSSKRFLWPILGVVLISLVGGGVWAALHFLGSGGTGDGDNDSEPWVASAEVTKGLTSDSQLTIFKMRLPDDFSGADRPRFGVKVANGTEMSRLTWKSEEHPGFLMPIIAQYFPPPSPSDTPELKRLRGLSAKEHLKEWMDNMKKLETQQGTTTSEDSAIEEGEISGSPAARSFSVTKVIGDDRVSYSIQYLIKAGQHTLLAVIETRSKPGTPRYKLLHAIIQSLVVKPESAQQP